MVWRGCRTISISSDAIHSISKEIEKHIGIRTLFIGRGLELYSWTVPFQVSWGKQVQILID